MDRFIEYQKRYKDSTDVTSNFISVPDNYNISRYKYKEQLKTRDIILTTTSTRRECELLPSINISSQTTHIVKAREQYRLDLIAHMYYGDPFLYWVIAYANDLMDMMYVPLGTELIIPKLTDLTSREVRLNG